MSSGSFDLAPGVTGYELDPSREDEVGVPLTLHTTQGNLRVALHRSHSPSSGIVWVYGAWGGLDGPADGIYPTVAEDLLTRSLTSLRVDYRDPRDLSKSVLDTLAGVSFLKYLGCSKVALVGHSFGGAVVISAAPLSQEVTAVVALSSQTAGARNVSMVSPRPILLVHGEADTRLPPSCSQDIYQWAKEPKELVLFPGATHGLRQCKDQLRDLLNEWLTRNLEKPR
ncbi:alpha/beta hydrolase [SAR202 cluster bacterium AC-647-N09_OGT_505m]|nr:alpha/beta hydrolase [SAR202 cluster bacterium AC-647-N09_OGT_505m]